MAEELGERTEDPTGKRYSEAREKGQVAKSQDLAAAIDWAGVLVMLLLLGSLLVKSMGSVMRRSLEDAGSEGSLALGNLTATVFYSAGQSVIAVLPFFLAFVAVTVVAHFAQYGALFTSQPIQPNLNKLNPITGFGKIFSAKGAVRTVLSLLKVILVSIIAYCVLTPEVPLILQLPQLPLIGGLYRIWTMMLALAAWLIVVLLVLGVADYMYQRWMLKQDLKMTKQEVKEERKSMDGDPLVRGRRLQMMRSIAMQRVNQTVPQADVIVTNPTHFSVAIRYSQDEMAAPRVIAKGADFMAMRIRQLAMINNVPIVERPALARALFYAIEVGHEVPHEHYQAVAEVLAYVYRLEGRAA
ncbi:MAG: flagellar biosynthesis protein FlhB [Phycisphaeraceae bacterium]|nr:flagellar biosynthesis protein FlhB [Phycisphaeraceae bacterium]